jgi:hypothetical protein
MNTDAAAAAKLPAIANAAIRSMRARLCSWIDVFEAP